MLYTIRNEDLMAQVSSSGAQLMSLEGKNHTQYLWRGNPRYWSDRSLTILTDCACLFSKRNTDITSNIEKA